jgi:hypothetical protein
LQTWGQRLGQFIGLLAVGDNQGIQVSRASNLELGLRITLADLDQLSIASASLLKEVTDICNLLWHCEFYKIYYENRKEKNSENFVDDNFNDRFETKRQFQISKLNPQQRGL